MYIATIHTPMLATNHADQEKHLINEKQAAPSVVRPTNSARLN